MKNFYIKYHLIDFRFEEGLNEPCSIYLTEEKLPSFKLRKNKNFANLNNNNETHIIQTPCLPASYNLDLSNKTISETLKYFSKFEIDKIVLRIFKS